MRKLCKQPSEIHQENSGAQETDSKELTLLGEDLSENLIFSPKGLGGNFLSNSDDRSASAREHSKLPTTVILASQRESSLLQPSEDMLQWRPARILNALQQQKGH